MFFAFVTGRRSRTHVQSAPNTDLSNSTYSSSAIPARSVRLSSNCLPFLSCRTSIVLPRTVRSTTSVSVDSMVLETTVMQGAVEKDNARRRRILWRDVFPTALVNATNGRIVWENNSLFPNCFTKVRSSYVSKNTIIGSSRRQAKFRWN